MRVGEVREAVIQRDQGCLAPRLDPAAGECRDKWGTLVTGTLRGMEVDRIREHPTMGKAPSHLDATHMVAVCSFHHQGGWATSHRPELRAYLRRLYPETWS